MLGARTIEVTCLPPFVFPWVLEFLGMQNVTASLTLEIGRTRRERRINRC